MRETWLSENQRLVSQDNFGYDLAAVEAATKKHEAIETDINAYEERVQAVVAVAQELENENYHDIERINSRFVSCFVAAVWGRGSPFPPLSIYFIIFSPFYFSLSFIGFTYFLLLSIPSLSTRIVPFRFQAGGRRKQPNLGLVCCVICIPELRWILVFCSIWFSLVLCVPSVL